MSERRLRVDPLLPWDGIFPYLAMRRFGITPDSTATDVLDASFAMTADQVSDAVTNDAWEALRITRTRLVADFFCLDLPDDTPAAPGTSHLSSLRFALAAAMTVLPPDMPLPEVQVVLPATLRDTAPNGVASE